MVGNDYIAIGLSTFLYCPPLPIDRQETQQLGFTYVQGMNVLAAPFLYTMPSELEAFFCFAKFIEEACPLYVQPTLEGVHKGLKVRLLDHLTFFQFGDDLIVPATRSMFEDCGP